MTEVPPITENEYFLSVMEQFGCKIYGIESYTKNGQDLVVFFLTIPADKCDEVISWINESIPYLVTQNSGNSKIKEFPKAGPLLPKSDELSLTDKCPQFQLTS